jgi:hypothetical protein
MCWLKKTLTDEAIADRNQGAAIRPRAFAGTRQSSTGTVGDRTSLNHASFAVDCSAAKLRPGPLHLETGAEISAGTWCAGPSASPIVSAAGRLQRAQRARASHKSWTAGMAALTPTEGAAAATLSRIEVWGVRSAFMAFHVGNRTEERCATSTIDLAGARPAEHPDRQS